MKKRSVLVWSERAFTMADDDWTLVDEAGIRLTRIFRLGIDDDRPWALAYLPGEWGRLYWLCGEPARRLRLSENERSLRRR